ncbi:hypothetical protein H072_1356 [Dactylellina haptotyla CBS 200.50]|uniref:Uncharacterized protein n=1 Tax=Dactylellina haptotyla (strain CBS 200.50) TaxID=1284197 RepID=S8BYV9_DACHA|nr:hypothetical protein H072_1356 [Dactylellina haptotyla CBS 200.50]
MSINIPCGSSNPIGAKMPPPSSPLPLPSEDAKDAVQKALHDRDTPGHLIGDSKNLPKGQDIPPETKGVEEPESTTKPFMEGGTVKTLPGTSI